MYIKFKYLILLLFVFIKYLFAQGNLNYYELGTSMYSELPIIWGLYENHWHSGVFNYFEFNPSNNKGYMSFTQANGPKNALEDYDASTKTEEQDISEYNYSSSLSTIRTKIKNLFKGSLEYYGSYSTTVVPSTRSAIVSTARTIGNSQISYTYEDMLDPINDYWFWDDWNGKISDIDELRCDGVTEYSYEKNGVLVSNGLLISEPDMVILDVFHNDLHTYGYEFPELCPKIQSGEEANVSTFTPLISANPIPSDFSTT